jgi:GGDEF domain-containing protein
MSLLKRLLLSLSVAILVILIGTLLLSINTARLYLSTQLQSESDNAATSLALSLSQPSNRDPVTRELLMLALFDSGQFRTVQLVDPEGKTLFKRQQDLHVQSLRSAPVWFARWLPIAEPQAIREVSDGWRQIGHLTVIATGSYAREALWRNTVQMTTLVLSAGALWALFVSLLFRWFRRVLREEVQMRVGAIGRAQLGQPSPSTNRPRNSAFAELSDVMQAIVDTQERVQITNQEASARIESLELELNLDPVTQLPNRKYFINELRRNLEGASHDAPQHGHVLLFRQRDLLAINAGLTRASADIWLNSAGQNVLAVLKQTAAAPRAQLARLNGSDFVILMPALEGTQALHVVQQVRRTLEAVKVRLPAGHWCRWAYALTNYTAHNSIKDVLGRLDRALMRAESSGLGEVEYLTSGSADSSANPIGEGEWQIALSSALNDPARLSLSFSVQNYQGRDHHSQLLEATLMLHESDGSTLGGALFLPIAMRLGLSADFDLCAISLSLQQLAARSSLPQQQSLVIRVSLASLAHPSFIEGVAQRLQATGLDGSVLRHLTLELDAHGLIAYPEETTAFSQVVQAAGAQLGLRRLDQQTDAIVHLHRYRLSYVKLGGPFVERAVSSPGSGFLLQALVDTAQSLQQQVYVTERYEQGYGGTLLERNVAFLARDEADPVAT